MSTKIKILDSDVEFEVQRGMAIPRDNEIFSIRLKGEKDERLYSVHLIEHFIDLNIPITTTRTLVTLKLIEGS